ncbi:MAG: hypothetical protein ABIH23_35640 [bacterium]
MFVFFFVAITGSLVSVCIIYKFTGLWLYPSWLTQILLSFYPFSILFRLLNDYFFDPLKKREESIYEWGPVLHWGYMLSILVFFCLLFALHFPFVLSFLISVVVCVVLPIVGYQIYRPLQIRYGETERWSAAKIADVAREHKKFQAFLEKAGKARLFVTDTKCQYIYARVCALHRFVLPEDPPVIQDAVFEVQVHMRRKRVVEGSEVFQSYLFRPEEECSVFVLPIRFENWKPNDPVNVDRVILEQLDTVPTRFPNLDRYPLPIASRGKEAVEVSIEKTEIADASQL